MSNDPIVELSSRIAKLERSLDVANSTLEIMRLHASYVWAIDSFDYDTLLELFCDEFVADYIGFGTFTTREQLKGFFDGARSYNLANCHASSTPAIDIDVEADRATGRWCFFGPTTMLRDSGPYGLWEQGVYDVEYRRERGAWKMKTFRVDMRMLSPVDEDWVVNPYGPAGRLFAKTRTTPSFWSPPIDEPQEA